MSLSPTVRLLTGDPAGTVAGILSRFEKWAPEPGAAPATPAD